MKPRFMEIAKKVAQKSDSKFRLACVITDKNKVLSFGWNFMGKTNPNCKTFSNYIHAENHALLGNSFRSLKGTTAYICRIKKDGSFGMARPCPICYESLKLAQVKKIVYTTSNGYKEEKL